MSLVLLGLKGGWVGIYIELRELRIKKNLKYLKKNKNKEIKKKK